MSEPKLCSECGETPAYSPECPDFNDEEAMCENDKCSLYMHPFLLEVWNRLAMTSTNGPSYAELQQGIEQRDATIAMMASDLSIIRAARKQTENDLDACLSRNERLRARVEKLEKVRVSARTLARKLKTIGEDLNFVAVFELAYAHFGQYNGPDWPTELESLNVALAACEEPTTEEQP